MWFLCVHNYPLTQFALNQIEWHSDTLANRSDINLFLPIRNKCQAHLAKHFWYQTIVWYQKMISKNVWYQRIKNDIKKIVDVKKCWYQNLFDIKKLFDIRTVPERLYPLTQFAHNQIDWHSHTLANSMHTQESHKKLFIHKNHKKNVKLCIHKNHKK